MIVNKNISLINNNFQSEATFISNLRLKDELTEQIDISFSCVCPVIGDQFSRNIVKVPVDPWVNSRVDPQTTFIDNFMTKFILSDTMADTRSTLGQ